MVITFSGVPFPSQMTWCLLPVLSCSEFGGVLEAWLCCRAARRTAAVPAPRRYSDELRERAVREVRATGRPIAHVARDLGLHKEALRGWVRQAEADVGERDDRLTTAEREELKQLRQEVAELRRTNDILKAASALFAQELDRPRTKPTR
ncbi:transposase [Streptomyces sp. 3MP-14]|uniref:Transposase n=1 Tax=Streptomyces mimosae TaxID=2586635 RepID=A0A5N6AD44_9ACTN|nr:transposase [Streptomyces mimosae]KAB8176079.1 transposase [Streptomyces sp. 3MP-14]